MRVCFYSNHCIITSFAFRATWIDGVRVVCFLSMHLLGSSGFMGMSICISVVKEVKLGCVVCGMMMKGRENV